MWLLIQNMLEKGWYIPHNKQWRWLMHDISFWVIWPWGLDWKQKHCLSSGQSSDEDTLILHIHHWPTVPTELCLHYTELSLSLIHTHIHQQSRTHPPQHTIMKLPLCSPQFTHPVPVTTSPFSSQSYINYTLSRLCQFNLILSLRAHYSPVVKVMHSPHIFFSLSFHSTGLMVNRCCVCFIFMYYLMEMRQSGKQLHQTSNLYCKFAAHLIHKSRFSLSACA